MGNNTIESIMNDPKPITYKEQKMCLGKTKHKCELAATTQLNELRKFSKTPQTLGTYQCEFCGFYHCGNNQKYL